MKLVICLALQLELFVRPNKRCAKQLDLQRRQVSSKAAEDANGPVNSGAGRRSKISVRTNKHLKSKRLLFLRINLKQGPRSETSMV